VANVWPIVAYGKQVSFYLPIYIERKRASICNILPLTFMNISFSYCHRPRTALKMDKFSTVNFPYSVIQAFTRIATDIYQYI
jgi:hypothetical protein